MTQSARHILLAEDNPVNQKVVVRMISRLGYEIDAVENGQLAVDAVKNGNYDLVFMDMMMPVMDGITATKTIRAMEISGPRIPIIALTANVEPKDERNCIEAGMDGFISKPFTLDQLKACLDRFLKPTFHSDKPEGINPQIMNAFLQNMGDGDMDFFKDILSDFLIEAAKTRSNIQAGLDNNDGSAVRHAAHSLKAASAVLGAQKLAECCRNLEGLGQAEDFDNIRLRLGHFDGLLNIVREELDQYLTAAETGQLSAL